MSDSRNHKKARLSDKLEKAKFEPLLPTCFPKYYPVFKENYDLSARQRFGDAAIFVFENRLPDYKERTFQEICDDEKVDFDKLKGLTKQVYLERLKSHTTAVLKFDEQCQSMFDDIMAHLSTDSRMLVTRDKQLFDKAKLRKDSSTLWALLEKAHTVKNRSVTPEETRRALRQLEELQQNREDGTTMNLEAYNKIWNKQLKDATAIGAM